jgi:hypothetical protein
MIVGSGDYRYEVNADWAKVPDGWSFKEVGGVGVDSNDNVYVFNRGEAGCQSWYKPSGISVTIVLCAGNVAERREVWPHASVDALSTGTSISTNCDPPSGAEAKRTIFIRALRNGALLGAGVAISPRFAALGQAVPPRAKES